MNKFEFISIKQPRIYLFILVFGITAPAAIFSSFYIDNIILSILVPLLMFLVPNWLSIYAAYGNLTVIPENDKLSFYWDKKHLFNFKKIDDIYLKDITTLVIENNEFLSEIWTEKSIVNFGGLKIGNKTSAKFTLFLIMYTNARIITPLQSMLEKGLIKTGFVIMSILLLSIAALFIWGIYSTGFSTLLKPGLWIMFLGLYSPLVYFWFLLKRILGNAQK